MKFKLTPKQCAHIINESFSPLLVENENVSHYERPIIKAIKLFGGIHMDNYVSTDIIKGILYGKGNFTLGKNVDLTKIGEGMDRLKIKLRFAEYWERFIKVTDGRGFAFEGLITGLFGGHTTETEKKQKGKNRISDVIIPSKGKSYSVKLVRNSKERFNLGSLKNSFLSWKKIHKNNEISDFDGTPYEFLINEYITTEEKKDFLKYSYRDLDIDGGFILGYVDQTAKRVNYLVLDKEVVINIAANDSPYGKLTTGKSGSKGYSIGIMPNYNESLVRYIQFPEFTEEDYRQLLGFRDGDHELTDIYRIFQDISKDDKTKNRILNYLRPEVLQFIKDNSVEFSKRLSLLNNE